jgi:hypothetical protein
LYINNLNERVHIEDMKQALYDIFYKYGKILDIKVKRNIRMRGYSIFYQDNLLLFLIINCQLNKLSMNKKIIICLENLWKLTLQEKSQIWFQKGMELINPKIKKYLVKKLKKKLNWNLKTNYNNPKFKRMLFYLTIFFLWKIFLPKFHKTILLHIFINI